MQPFKRIVMAGIVLLGTIGAFSALGTARFSPARANATEPDRALWKTLSLRGNHFLGKVKTDVFLADLPAGEVQAMLIPVPEGCALEVSTPRVMVIEVQSTVDPLLGAADHSGSQAWFLPGDAAALQRIRSRRGDDTWQNTYRYTDKGVYRIRKKPGRSQEKQLAPGHWTRVTESFYPYQPSGAESKMVMEPTGLLYLASVLDLRSQPASRSLYVFDRKQLHAVEVDVSGRRRLKVSYLEKSLKKEIQRKGMIDTVKISFKPRALVAHGEQPEQFSFMGLKGDFEIYIDAVSKIPVQVSGQIAGIGKIHIRLYAVEF